MRLLRRRYPNHCSHLTRLLVQLQQYGRTPPLGLRRTATVTWVDNWLYDFLRSVKATAALKRTHCFYLGGNSASYSPRKLCFDSQILEVVKVGKQSRRQRRQPVVVHMPGNEERQFGEW